MSEKMDESPVVEEPPARRGKAKLVFVLGALLIALLVAGVVGMVLNYRTGKVAKVEILALKKALKEKTQAHEELKLSHEALSSQVDLLKDYSVARSSGSGATGAAGEAASGCAVSADEFSALKDELKRKNLEQEAMKAQLEALSRQVDLLKGGAAERPVAAEPAPPTRTKKPKSDKPNCELVGKSKEEQEETLKRCVSLIDLPK